MLIIEEEVKKSMYIHCIFKVIDMAASFIACAASLSYIEYEQSHVHRQLYSQLYVYVATAG